ncbi:hypothetical protein ACIFOC_00491 [Leucobacter aridicollis]
MRSQCVLGACSDGEYARIFRRRVGKSGAEYIELCVAGAGENTDPVPEKYMYRVVYFASANRKIRGGQRVVEIC